MRLTSVEHIVIPTGVLGPTVTFLAERGTHGVEGFVVWGAKLRDEGRVLEFTSPYVPEQTSHVTRSGLLVTVEGDALHRMNRAFYARGEIAAGQVHTHPTDAYHSDTDDHFPLVTLCGALSIVLPDFARHGLDALDRWAWYRLVEQGEWEPLPDSVRVDLVDQVDGAAGADADSAVEDA